MRYPTLDFYFDYSCPYAYAASGAVEHVAARTGVPLRYRPFLLGGAFRAIGTAQNLATTLSPQKALHMLHDQQRAVQTVGLPFDFPPEHPRRTVAALRATLAAQARAAEPWAAQGGGSDARDATQRGRLGSPRPDPRALIHAYFRAYWADRCALDDVATVRAIAAEHGFPDLDLEAQRAPLSAATDTAIALGIFGAPAFVVGDELFWGHDRLSYVAHALGAPPLPSLPWPATPDVDFWFDYSSPFAYLASLQVPDTVRWQPFLLGALFKSLGQADVPLFAFPEAKRRWYLRDLLLHAEALRTPFRFSPHFPLRTVLALRCTLSHPEPIPFARRVFHAAWVDGLDISDPAVLSDLGGKPEAATRDALFAQTERALVEGVFGTPTFIVRAHGQRYRFWGQDRIEQVKQVLHGWVAPGAL